MVFANQVTYTRAGGGGWEAKGKLYHPLEQEQGHCVFNEAQKQPQCSYMSGQDSRWQQFDITCSLISAPHTLQWTVMNLQG